MAVAAFIAYSLADAQRDGSATIDLTPDQQATVEPLLPKRPPHPHRPG